MLILVFYNSHSADWIKILNSKLEIGRIFAAPI